MSLYAVHELLVRARNDADFEDRLRREPERVLDELELDADERRELESGDVRALYDRGVNAYLLFHLPLMGLFGLDPPTYFARLRA